MSWWETSRPSLPKPQKMMKYKITYTKKCLIWPRQLTSQVCNPQGGVQNRPREVMLSQTRLNNTSNAQFTFHLLTRCWSSLHCVSPISLSRLSGECALFLLKWISWHPWQHQIYLISIILTCHHHHHFSKNWNFGNSSGATNISSQTPYLTQLLTAESVR